MELRLPYWVFGCGRKNKALRERQEEHALGFRCCGVLTVFQEFYSIDSIVDMFTQLGSSLGTLRVGQYKEHRSVRDVLVYQEKEPHCWPLLAQLYHLQDPVGTTKWHGTSGWKQSVDIQNTWITAAQGWSIQEEKHSFAIEAFRTCIYCKCVSTSLQSRLLECARWGSKKSSCTPVPMTIPKEEDRRETWERESEFLWTFCKFCVYLQL